MAHAFMRHNECLSEYSLNGGVGEEILYHWPWEIILLILTYILTRTSCPISDILAGLYSQGDDFTKVAVRQQGNVLANCKNLRCSCVSAFPDAVHYY